jgi:two-component system, cell cycle sensor histidine kinase and response regulator CckA
MSSATMVEFGQDVLDAMGAHICVVNEDGVLIALNRAWTNFPAPDAGSAPPLGVGANYFQICEAAANGPEAEDARRASKGIRAVILGECVEFVAEYSCHSPAEQRWFEIRATRLLVSGRPHAVVVHSDITPRRQAQEALRRTEEQLRQAQKLEAMGRLAGGIAHDFNNLLTVINNYTDFVAAALHEADPLHCELSEIRRAGDRAAALTHQLMAFSRRQVLQARPLDLNRIVTGLEPMLRRLIGEDIRLVLDLAPRLEPVLGDPHQVEQVIINLAMNGRDAMPSGGVLHVATLPAGTPGEDGVRHVRLVVSDTGCGMDAETKARIFEPFFTTKAEGVGTGLGLSTVFGIVHQSGGHIEVTTAPQQGTSFTIALSVTGEAPIEVDGRAEAAPLGAETILLVEDDVTVREIARRLLKHGGYTVVVPTSATEAIQHFSRHPGRVDLVLTDVVMPDMSGPELVRRLSALVPRFKVLYMSGYTAKEIEPHGIPASGSMFMPKPFRAPELARRVRQALDEPA